MADVAVAGRTQEDIDAELASLQATMNTLRAARNALSPVARLPPELLAQIFLRLCDATAGPSLPAARRDRAAWLTVVRVCRQWRYAALDFPALWSVPDLANPERARAMIARARASLLTLEAYAPGFSPQRAHAKNTSSPKLDALSLALREMARVRTLDLTLDGPTLKHAVERLRSSPAPELRSIRLRGGPLLHVLNNGHLTERNVGIPKDLLSNRAERLHVARLSHIDMRWTIGLWRNLRTLDVREISQFGRPVIERWLRAISAMRQLEVLVLQNCTPRYDGDGSAASFLADQVGGTLTTLPHVHTLRMLAPAHEIAYVIRNLSLPQLKNLELAAPALATRAELDRLVGAAAPHAHRIAPFRAVSVASGRLANMPGFQLRAHPDTLVPGADADTPATDAAEAPDPARALAAPHHAPGLVLTLTAARPLVLDAACLAHALSALPLAEAEVLALTRLPRAAAHDPALAAALARWTRVRVLQLAHADAWAWAAGALAREALFPALRRLVLSAISVRGAPADALADALRRRAAKSARLDELRLLRGAVSRARAADLAGVVGTVRLPPAVLERHRQRAEREARAKEEAEADAAAGAEKTAAGDEDEVVSDDGAGDWEDEASEGASMPSLQSVSDASSSASGGSDWSEDDGGGPGGDELDMRAWVEAGDEAGAPWHAHPHGAIHVHAAGPMFGMGGGGAPGDDEDGDGEDAGLEFFAGLAADAAAAGAGAPGGADDGGPAGAMPPGAMQLFQQLFGAMQQAQAGGGGGGGGVPGVPAGFFVGPMGPMGPMGPGADDEDEDDDGPGGFPF